MADPINLDDLSDEEVMNMSPEEVQTLQDQENAVESGESIEVEEDPVQADDVVDNGEDPDVSVPSGSDDDVAEHPEDPEAEEVNDPDPSVQSGIDPNDTPSGEDPTPEQSQDESSETPENEEPEKKPKEEVKKDAPVVDQNTTAAVDFYTKITAPFKADGREIQVRSPEDAIRLMQKGVNYSRRMEEMKPMRALNNMLQEHGLNDVNKLNELIDLSKGTPEAVQKFLKDKGIDPLDIDTTKETNYRTPNYQADPKDVEFKEAIDNTLARPGGRELLQDVNSLWDAQSKEALRDQPALFDNLLEQKDSGVYDKIKGELEYQRTMGYLAQVPFLQAYHQVGDAMQKAGVFDKPKEEVQSDGLAPLQAQVPLDTGTRKAANTPKNVQPNPNLSSTTQPRSVTPQKSDEPNTPDYSSMSDEDFLKLGAPG